MDYTERTLRLIDGIKLKAKLWKPDGFGPWPALLMRQPYGSKIASTVTYAHPTWWASNGYLVIVQDVRGQGDSEGEFLGFKQEASDTSQTHKSTISVISKDFLHFFNFGTQRSLFCEETYFERKGDF